jgi:hypothetical protein
VKPSLRPLSAGLVFFLTLACFTAAVPAFSLGRRDKTASPPAGGLSAEPPEVPVVNGPGGPVRGGDLVELEGRVRLLGSEPFPDLVLTSGDDEDWYLEGPSRRALQPYEQRIVRVRGRVELREMVLANGRSLGFRRFLADAELAETGDSPD